ncbi:MAG TPA: hypothetical protein VNK05_08140, partial [Chloroflexota bacterium]|nr:hypothetical protein [Chloroflexota bacterium]
MRDPAPPPSHRYRPARRALGRLAARALAVTVMLALVLPMTAPPGPRPAGAQGTTATAPAGTPTPGPRPPQDDPAGPPSAYTIARSDQLFVAKTPPEVGVQAGVQAPSAFGSTYTVKPDLSGVSSSTPYTDTDLPAGQASWNLIPVRGRFTDPLHEQALLLSQSNDCASGSTSCTYTHVLGSAPGQGSAVTPWLWQVQGESGGSPVAVAAGDLDGRMSAQGFPNDEAVVAYRWPDGTLRVSVIDYNAAPGQVVETAPRVPMPAIGTAAGPGSLGVGVGDFDSDGQNEVAVLWQGGGCTGTTPRCVSAPHLTMLRYSNTGALQTLAVLQADIPLPASLMTGSPAPTMGFQVVVDDFDGEGVDELAFSFIDQDASLAVLGFTPLDETFAVARFGRDPGDFSTKSYCPDSGCNAVALGSPPRLAAGLFWYDQASGHDLGRRQLALVALDQWLSGGGQTGGGGDVSLQLYDVSFDASTCAQNPCPLKLTGLLGQATALGDSLGYVESSTFPFAPTVSLAAGSFQGLVLTPSDASQVPWALATGFSGRRNATSTPTFSSVSLYRLSGTAPGSFSLTSLFTAETDQTATAPRLLAYDPAGASLVLGAPLVFSMSDHYVPSYILQDPPKHLDWFYDPQQKHGSWLNVDRSKSLNLTVTDTTTSTYSSQTTTGSDWTIGGSLTSNTVASGASGLGPVANAGAGLDVSVEVGDQYDKNQSGYNQSSSSYTQSLEGATDDDDLLAGTSRTWQIYRYPILGRTLKNAQGQPVLGPGGQPQYGFYEITLPGQTVPFGPGDGRGIKGWYQPVHQNGIAFSYPPIDTGTGVVPVVTPTAVATPPPGSTPLPTPVPGAAVLGAPVVLAGATPAAQLTQPLLNKAYEVGATGSSVELSIAQTSGSGNTTSTNNTLSESADVDGALTSKMNIGVEKVSACTDLDLKVSNSNSWSSLNTSSSSTTSTNTFTLQQDSAAQGNWAYGAATVYYTDPSGTYRASHAVNILADGESQSNWKAYYGNRPDPALNLPNRMVMATNQGAGPPQVPNWNNADSRQLIRGFFVLHPDAANGGPAGSLQAGAEASYPTDGDTVQLQVRVHNYSLDTAATAVPVEFWAVPRDAGDDNNVGSPVKLGTVTLDRIPPLGWVPANFLWGTSGAAPTGAQLYRIFVVVARNDASKGAADPWNNVIHALNDRYDDPATIDGTPSSDRLVDPFTGQYETLEAGQNKQGYGEVIIYPKSAAPAPLAAARGAAQTPALRFGSGGLRVTAPGARAGAAAAAGAPAGPVAGRVHEVRVQLAATATALGNSFCHDDNNSATLQVYDGAPEQGGRLVGMERVRGLAGSGPAGRTVTLSWTPREAGRRQLVARLYGASMDPRATPVQTTVDVDVALPAAPPATLGRLLEVLRVVWLPADLRAALAARVQAANSAALAGDQPGARAALTALEAQTAAARGATVSGYSVSRVGALVDDLLAQPAIAAYCLPA